jgi:hypothetical protein
MDVRYGQIDHQYGARLATTPAEQDGPVWMVNLMKYRDTAVYADGRPTDISGRHADDLYTPTGPLAAIGATIVFAGDVDTQLLGDPSWDRIGVVRYPTRRSFIDMQTLPEFREKHAHKDAGMERTIVMGCQPLPHPEPPAGVGSADWSTVEHPPTPDDGPVMVLHVIRYHEPAEGGGTPEDMEAYQSAAMVTAGRHGGRIAGWFAVEGTIVGDGRAWHEVRFNLFPSKAAFLAVVQDPDRLDAQRRHREPAIADTFAMIVRPTLDRLSG